MFCCVIGEITICHGICFEMVAVVKSNGATVIFSCVIAKSTVGYFSFSHKLNCASIVCGVIDKFTVCEFGIIIDIKCSAWAVGFIINESTV